MNAPEALSDPLSALGSDLLLHVLSYLDLESLKHVALAGHAWRTLASDDALWRRHCEEEWATQVFTPAAQRTDLSWKQRHLLARADASRTDITVEELCTFRWRFRFKPQAGEYWMALDPFYTGQGPPMQRLFSEDHSVCAAPGDPLWGEHETRWRFCKTREGVRGHFVKINHWPSLDCTRTPDGGWCMQNMWVVYETTLEPGGAYSRGLPPGLARHLA